MTCPYCHSELSEPGLRFCPSCGGDIHAAAPASDLGVAATPSTSSGADGAYASSQGTAWERREQVGLAAALIDTTKSVLFEPARFFREMSPSGGIGAPLLYGTLLGYIGVLASTLYQLILGVITGGGRMITGDSALEKAFGGASVGISAWQAVAHVILAPFVLPIALFATAGIYHVVLLALRGANRDYEATLRVVCYGSATAVFELIPICGGLIGLVYFVVVASVGLSEAHGVSRGKGVAAVLIPWLLCCCCVAIAFSFMFASIASLLNRS